MSKEDDKALQEKLAKLRSQWVNAENNAKKQNLDVAGEKKEKTDKIIASVEKLGVPAKAWRHEMVLLDHADAIIGKREDVVDADNVDVLQHFDRLTLLIGPDTLPLFDAATKTAMKKSAAKAGAEEEEEVTEKEPTPKGDGKVVSLKPQFEDAAAG